MLCGVLVYGGMVKYVSQFSLVDSTTLKCFFVPSLLVSQYIYIF